MTMKSGLEVFLSGKSKRFQSVQLGLLCNQASVDKNLRHAAHLVTDPKLKLNLKIFFGPQHGIRGEKQDNMIESPDFVDTKTQKPIVSLYSNLREPKPEHLKEIDVLLIDLQDIGCRIYTFMYTLANCMRVASSTGCKVVVLDRPNPIGGNLVDGNVLEEAFTSFVGQYPICTQHGMTMGELAKLFNTHFKINCELEVIKHGGWKREMQADKWGRAWVPPSPNIPTLDSTRLFPGTVLFEGTNISEGRGTTKPFEWIGAPFIDPDQLANHMNQKKLPGVFFRPNFFQPSYQKHRDTICGGVQIHILDPKKLRPVGIGTKLLYSIRELYGEKLEWKQPPYEYEYEKLPIDLIAGTDRLRIAVDKQAGLDEFDEWANETQQAFKKIRAQFVSK